MVVVGICSLDGRNTGRRDGNTPILAHTRTYGHKLAIVTGGIIATYSRKLANSLVH